MPYLATRREVLKQAAVLALGPALLAGQGLAADKPAPGFKLGGVDWELKGPNDPEALAVAARLGFDGCQVDLGNVEAMRNPQRQKMYLAQAEKHHVEISSLALGILSSHPLATDKRSGALIDAAIDIAVAMKQKIILLACFDSNDINVPAKHLDAFVGRVKEQAPKAEKAGVTLGLEGECTVEHYKKVLDRIGSPAVKAYFDTQHAHRPGRDVVQEITFLKDQICEFHAKDYTSILLGQGKIDFARVRQGMDAIGYRGWLMLEQWVEIQGQKPLGFDETHRRNLKYLRGLFPPCAKS